MGRFALITLLSLFPLLGFAQPDTLWTATIDSSKILAVATMPEGGFVVSGYYFETDGRIKLMLRRYSSSGHAVWTGLVYTSQEAERHMILVSDENGIAVLAALNIGGYLYRFSMFGENLLSHYYPYRIGTANIVYFQSIVELANDNYLIVGDFESPYTGTFFARITSNADVLWTSLYLPTCVYSSITGISNGGAAYLSRENLYNIDTVGHIYNIGPYIFAGNTYAQYLREEDSGNYIAKGLYPSVDEDYYNMAQYRISSDGYLLSEIVGDSIEYFPDTWSVPKTVFLHSLLPGTTCQMMRDLISSL